MKPKSKSLGNVFWIGTLAFFGGISQDMFVPILPLYLTNVLGLSPAFVGVSEGLVTSAASLFKLVAGYLTDKLHSRKSIIFVGYALSLISRPLLAIFTVPAGIAGLRFMDGVGKGVKDTPKDALIADSTEIKTRGKSFGVARLLDTLGSVAGPLVLFGLLALWKTSPHQYQYILYVTAIPLLFTLGILIWKVRESTPTQRKGFGKGKLPKSFYVFLGTSCLFTLGNSSDAFLILRAQNVGVAVLAIPLVYALFNLVYASAAVPLGALSDRIGRERVMIMGWVAYAVAYAGFAWANRSWHIWLLFAFYGLYYATTTGVSKAMIADLVDPSVRGRAYGLFNTLIGLLSLPASALAGYLWDRFSPATPFFFGAVLALLSSAALGVFIYYFKRPTDGGLVAA